MSQLTSHDKYQLYKHCISLGVPHDIAVKIRENSYWKLETLLKVRDFETEVEDIVRGAFNWNETTEGFTFWNEFLDEFLSKQKGVK